MKNCGGISFFRSVSKSEDQNKSHLTFNYQIQETQSNGFKNRAV